MALEQHAKVGFAVSFFESLPITVLVCTAVWAPLFIGGLWLNLWLINKIANGVEWARILTIVLSILGLINMGIMAVQWIIYFGVIYIALADYLGQAILAWGSAIFWIVLALIVGVPFVCTLISAVQLCKQESSDWFRLIRIQKDKALLAAFSSNPSTM